MLLMCCDIARSVTAMTRIQRIIFEGGPLDGTHRDKSRPGRWAAGLDEQGNTLPIQKVDRNLRTSAFGMYVSTRGLPTTDGSIRRVYVWWPPKQASK